MFHNKLNNTHKLHYYANEDLNISIIANINNHDYETLTNLLTPYLTDIIVINATYATIHLIIADSNVDRHVLFNAHNHGQINIHKLTGLTYVPELEEPVHCFYPYYKSESILNIIREYTTRYKLLAIDIKILYLLINQYNVSNKFIFTDYILSYLPKEYEQIFINLFLSKHPINIEETYQELQNIFSDKIYTAVKSILNTGDKLNITLSILDEQLSSADFKQHADLQHILTKTLDLLKTYDASKKLLFFLHSHYKSEIILPDWQDQDEPIQNSRLYRIYKKLS